MSSFPPPYPPYNSPRDEGPEQYVPTEPRSSNPPYGGGYSPIPPPSPTPGQRSPWFYVSIILSILLVGSLGGLAYLLLMRSGGPLIQSTPTAGPTSQPTSGQGATPTAIRENVMLSCISCQEPKVLASFESYLIDPGGTTTFTLKFTDNTANGLTMKVNTIKLLDQNDASIPVQSNDPYIAVGSGQSAPMTIVFNFTPQPGIKYTLTINVEQSNKFVNAYQSPPFTLA